MKIVWSPLAVDRAVTIARFISRDRPAAARRWLEGLFASVERLPEFPLRGRILPEMDRPEYRELIYRSHRVIYRIAGESILILTVRHGRQLLDFSEIHRKG